MVKDCRRDYTVKSASLAQFLQLELNSTLFLVFSRIHFPFEEPVDFNTLKPQLVQTAQILKCLRLINIETSPTKNTEKELSPNEEPMELVLGEFDKRFNYHFYGDKKTNLPSKPEWFFSQLSCWAENNLEYFEVYLQPFVDEMQNNIKNNNNIYYSKQSTTTAKQIFLERLMKLASEKSVRFI
uniref:Uncharacterized protein n=1 Tax=Meloidogyne enterolobii TaxID=390850 RepID=A0A6V7UWI7_MELEN|nr:unnamed protein product [Meloidogyne enterolobii]